MASTILVDREGVECEKLHALQGHSRVETAMKAKMRFEFDVFGVNLQRCLSLRLPLGSCEYFFESYVNQTVDRLGTRVEFTETEDLSKNDSGQRNLPVTVGFLKT